MLDMQRRRELKNNFPDGKAIGKAFVQSYIERRKNSKNPNFEITLTSEEIHYLRSTIKTKKNKELFSPYYSLYRLLRQFVRWIEHYEHVYYHGLFRDLAVVQTPDYDIQIYHLLKSQSPIDEQAIERAKKRYTQSLVPVVQILLHNWHELMEFPLQKLYCYSLRLVKIQELTKYDLTPLLPDIEHHENEVRELQRIAGCFRDNLDEFIQSDLSILKPTEQEKEENTQQAIEAIYAIEEVME